MRAIGWLFVVVGSLLAVAPRQASALGPGEDCICLEERETWRLLVEELVASCGTAVEVDEAGNIVVYRLPDDMSLACHELKDQVDAAQDDLVSCLADHERVPAPAGPTAD